LLDDRENVSTYRFNASGRKRKLGARLEMIGLVIPTANFAAAIGVNTGGFCGIAGRMDGNRVSSFQQPLSDGFLGQWA